MSADAVTGSRKRNASTRNYVIEDEEESDDAVVAAVLVTGSKNRNAKSKKTIENKIIIDADKEFLMMHGPGDFSNLKYNALVTHDVSPTVDTRVRTKNPRYL